MPVTTDETPLLSLETGTFVNRTGYNDGINEVLVGIAGLTGTPTAAEFEFRTGHGNDLEN